MILNTFLRQKKVNLSQRQKMFLGRRFVNSFRDRYPNFELQKVRIRENGESVEVIDYPRSFMDKHGDRILARFLAQRKRYFENKKQQKTTEA